MTLRPDDPKLSAWLLGELSAEESAEIERAVAADPALKLAAHEMELVQRLLSNTLSAQSDCLFPRQRNIILQEARRMDDSSRVVVLPARAKTPVSWFFPIAAAAVLALASWLLIQLPGGDESEVAEGRVDAKKPETAPVDPAAWPSPAPADLSVASGVMPATQSVDANPKFPVLVPRSAVSALENPVFSLPVQAGAMSFDWVTQAIRRDKRLPHPDAVRLEEILNHFTLRPSGTASLANGVALCAESVPCPWRPSAELLVVTLRGAVGDARDVAAEFHPNPSVVRSYRLLGYARAQGATVDVLPTKLAAGLTHSLVIEVQSHQSSTSFGSIQWTVDGQDAPVLDVIRRADAPPSDDARFAALVAACSLWLSDPSGAIDSEMVEALIREHRSSAVTPERADFLFMMEEAIAIAAQ
jgi:hypothetical protein